MLTWKEFSVQALLLIAFLVPAFPGLFFRGEIISSADILFLAPFWSPYGPEDFTKPQNRLAVDPLLAFRPDYVLVKNEVAAGEWPLWNPLEYAGMPLMANAQSAVFNPLHLLLYVLDVDTAMTAFVLLKLWLCGLVAYVCTRLMGLGVWPARFFSVAWMIGSYNLLWANWPLPDVSIWVPALVLGVEFLLDGRYRRGFCALAFGATLILFAGHPETAFSMGLGVGLYFVFRLIWERRWAGALWKPVVLVGAAWAVAFAVSMVQLLPLLEYIAHSYTVEERTTTYELEHMPVTSAAAFWVPRFFGTRAEDTFWDEDLHNSNIISGQYLGMAAWCGIALLLVSTPHLHRSPRRRAQIASLLLAAFTGVLLAYRFPLFEAVQSLPFFNATRPVYHIGFALFALPLAATLGLERWFARPRAVWELWPVAGLLALGAALVAFVFYWDMPLLTLSRQLAYVREQVAVAAAWGAVASAILIGSCLWHRPRLFWGVLTVFLAADHLYACRGLNPTMPRAFVYPETEITRFFEEQPQPCRIGVAEAGVVSGAVANYGIEEWLGYDGLFPERMLRYQIKLGWKVWNVMEPINGIQFYLNNPTFGPQFPLQEKLAEGTFVKVATLDGYEVYRNRAAFPRAFLVGALEVIPDLGKLFKRMIDPAYRPGEIAVSEVNPSAPVPTAPSASVGTATITHHGATEVRVDVRARAPAVLVLTDAYYPGWTASIDGQPLDLFPVYHTFRGAIVPPGVYTVSYCYFPSSLKLGLIFSMVTLSLSAVVSLRHLLRTRQTSSDVSPPPQ